MTVELCPCGDPLHYSDPKIRADVESLIASLGPAITVSVIGGKGFKVPRHYIALHGLCSVELPEIAAKLGFEEVV